MLPVAIVPTALRECIGIERPIPPDSPARLASEAISAAATHGTIALLGGRVVVTCDLSCPVADRYSVAVDGEHEVGPVRARYAHAVVAGHAAVMGWTPA